MPGDQGVGADPRDVVDPGLRVVADGQPVDGAHLGIAFCRAPNIPAHCCTGYVAGVELATPDEPMDFSGWFAVYLDRQTGDQQSMLVGTPEVLVDNITGKVTTLAYLSAPAQSADVA